MGRIMQWWSLGRLPGSPRGPVVWLCSIRSDPGSVWAWHAPSGSSSSGLSGPPTAPPPAASPPPSPWSEKHTHTRSTRLQYFTLFTSFCFGATWAWLFISIGNNIVTTAVTATTCKHSDITKTRSDGSRPTRRQVEWLKCHWSWSRKLVHKLLLLWYHLRVQLF